MGSTGGEASMTSGGSAAPSSEATVEIKIKTLDSQTYTMRVDKCVNLLSRYYSELSLIFINRLLCIFLFRSLHIPSILNFIKFLFF